MKNISSSPISNSYYYLKSEDIDISKLNINNNDELIFNIIGFYNDFSDKFPKLYQPKESTQKIIEFNLEEYVNFKLDDKNVYKFEFKNFSVGKQFLYFYFNNAMDLYIYLTELNGESKRINYYRYFNNFDAFLTNSGIYYLEFYQIYDETEYKNEDSFIVILLGLIDIIDFSKNSYTNKKSIKLDNSANIDNVNKYYMVKNLKENKKVIFTYKIEANSYSESPFTICNNNTNICNDNVVSYYFEKGNEYTIFINFIEVYPKYGNFYYYYPIFEFYCDSSESNESSESSESSSDSNSLVYIICGCAFGFIVILIVLFLIIRYFKKKNQSTDFIKETNTLNNENLLSDV